MKLAHDFYSKAQLHELGISVLGDDGANWIVGDPPSGWNQDTLTHMLERSPLSRVTIGALRSPTPERPQLPTLNHLRRTRLSDERWLVSVETGQWLILDDVQMEHAISLTYDEELRHILERNFIVLTEANFGVFERQLQRRLFFLREGPTLHIMVVTSKCNLACTYCQASAHTVSSGSNMTLETALLALDRIYESPGKSIIIEFQGGEPLLNFPVVRAVIEEARERSIKNGFRTEFSICSNFSSTMTREKAAFLIDNEVSVCFSLDGPEELHDANRGDGYPKLYRRTVDNVALFRTVWCERRSDTPRLTAMLTVTRASLPKLDAIINIYVDLGLSRISLRPLSMVGNAIERAGDLDYTSDEFLEFWKKGVETVLRMRAIGIDITETYLELILTKLFAHETGYMDWRSPCGAGIGQIAYNWDGSTYTCDEGRMVTSSTFRMGNVNQPLGDLLISPQCIETLDASLTEQLFCDFCAFRPYCGICPVLNLSENGHMLLGVARGKTCNIRKGMIEHVLHLFEQSPQNQVLLAGIIDGVTLQSI